MKLTPLQLRKVIKEEVAKIRQEGLSPFDVVQEAILNAVETAKDAGWSREDLLEQVNIVMDDMDMP